MSKQLKDYLFYQDDWATIYCGDCLFIMPLMEPESVDLVVTDPPYGISMDEGFEGFEGFGGLGIPIARRHYSDTWDKERPPKECFSMILKLSKNILIFGGNFFSDYLPVNGHWIVWDKLNTMPSFGDCELIWTNIKRNSVKKIVREYNGLMGKEETRYHPTQKPLDLIGKLISNYGGQMILDPFLGSGTTCLASKNLNRKSIGIEINPRYCEISVRRLRQEVFDFRKEIP